MRVVEMVLSGEINKNITSLLTHHGAKAIGISGKDSSMINAVPKDGGKFGYTGEITKVNGEMINNLIKEGFIPVIAPIGDSAEPNHPGFNINADVAACEIAVAVKAQKVLFLTDTIGVLDKDKNLIASLDKHKVEAYKKDGTIAGGMIPKVDSCIDAVHNGVNKAHIIDGRVEHSILLELFTNEGIGTQFIRKDNPNNGIDIEKLLSE
jgi:acetylglutamate kinase